MWAEARAEAFPEWLGEAAAANRLPARGRGSFLGEPWSLQAQVLSVPWDTKEGTTLALLHHLLAVSPPLPLPEAGRGWDDEAGRACFNPSAHGRPDQGSRLSPVGVS